VYHGEVKEETKQDKFAINWIQFDKADEKLTKKLTQG
jgi:hypothetical protein